MIDKNFDQELDFDEFKLFIRICQNADPYDEKSILFYATDIDYSDTIDYYELMLILKKLGVNASQQQIDEIMKQNCDRADGTISYDTFVKFMSQLY